MNLPLVVGGGAAVVGLAAGVIGERMTHDSLEAKKADVNARANEWLAGVNDAFKDEIEADRLRNRELEDRIEDYELQHPKPGEVSWNRDQAGYPTSVAQPGRDGFWGITAGAGGGGGLVVGGMTWAISHDSGSAAGAAVGAGILGAGVGLAAGSIISNWTH
jgi:hypothetical protein